MKAHELRNSKIEIITEGNSFTLEKFIRTFHDSPFSSDLKIYLLEFLSAAPNITVQTSGSSGRPKQFLVNKTHMINSARASLDYFDLKPGDSVLLSLSMTSIGGRMQVVRALLGDLKLVMIPPSNNPLKDLPYKVDFAPMVPLQVTGSLDLIDEKVGTLIIGGAPLMPEQRKQMAKLKKTRVYQTYGMTETLSHIAVRRLDLEKEQPYEAMPNVKFSVNDNGCLVIDAPHLGAENLETTDVVELVDGTHFFWQGRADLVINSGGIKIHPEEVEERLEDVIDTPFFVFGIPDKDFGEKLILVVEGPERHIVFPDGMGYQKPRDVFFIPELVKTHTGKLDRIKTVEAVLKDK